MFVFCIAMEFRTFRIQNSYKGLHSYTMYYVLCTHQRTKGDNVKEIIHCLNFTLDQLLDTRSQILDVCRQRERQRERQLARQMDGWMDGWRDRLKMDRPGRQQKQYIMTCSIHIHILAYLDRWIDGWMDIMCMKNCVEQWDTELRLNGANFTRQISHFVLISVHVQNFLYIHFSYLSFSLFSLFSVHFTLSLYTLHCLES